jgi:tetratricopeptide (TPR) repeat protein
MATGGQSARDGGKTRGAFLRRAAAIIYRDIEDVNQAFSWLGDSLIAHVDSQTLDALEELAREIGEPRRAEETLGRAIGEVFEAHFVRELLTRRAKMRRDTLADPAGAASDLRKLYDLAPSDQQVAEQLGSLYIELGNHSALVSLYEDQILRSKDSLVRADLARRVAHMWEDDLDDPREAADAWRRVLRLKPGDAEATSGLERMKATMLRRASSSGASGSDSKSSTSSPQAGRSRGSPPTSTARRPLRASPGSSAESGDIPPSTRRGPPGSSPVPLVLQSTEIPFADGKPAMDSTPRPKDIVSDSSPDPIAELAKAGKGTADSHDAVPVVAPNSRSSMVTSSASPSSESESDVDSVSSPLVNVEFPTDDEQESSDDVLSIDDIAEVMDDEPASAIEEAETSASRAPPKGKRSIPPPLPRG